MSLQSKDCSAPAVPYHGINRQWDTAFSVRLECCISLLPSLFILSRGWRTVRITGADDQMFLLSQNTTVQYMWYNYTSSFQFTPEVTFRTSATWKECQVTTHDLPKINHKKWCKTCDSCLFLSFMWLYVSPRSRRCASTENWKGALWESWTPLHLHTVIFKHRNFLFILTVILSLFLKVNTEFNLGYSHLNRQTELPSHSSGWPDIRQDWAGSCPVSAATCGSTYTVSMLPAGAWVGGRVLLLTCSTSCVDTLSTCQGSSHSYRQTTPFSEQSSSHSGVSALHHSAKLRVPLQLFWITDTDEAFEKEYALLFSSSNSSGWSCTKADTWPPGENWPAPEHLSTTTCKANACWRARTSEERLLKDSQELAGRVLSKRINSVPGRKKVAIFQCIYYKTHLLHTATSEAHTAREQG